MLQCYGCRLGCEHNISPKLVVETGLSESPVSSSETSTSHEDKEVNDEEESGEEDKDKPTSSSAM